MQHPGIVRAHPADPPALAQHADDVGSQQQLDAVLARRLQVGVGQAERADLVVAEEFQRAVGRVADRRLGTTQFLAVQPAHLLGQMRDLRHDVLGVLAILVVLDHVFQAGALELEVHPVAFDQFSVQFRVQRVGLQGEVEERRRQDVRRARVHRHRRALGLAPVAGGHHAEEDHPAAQPHRFADGPEAAGRGAGGVARSLVVDHGDAQVAAPGQLVGAGRADHAAAGNHDVIGSVHVQASVPRFWNAENGIGSIGKRGRSQPTSWRPVARRRRSLQ